MQVLMHEGNNEKRLAGAIAADEENNQLRTLSLKNEENARASGHRHNKVTTKQRLSGIHDEEDPELAHAVQKAREAQGRRTAAGDRSPVPSPARSPAPSDCEALG